MICEKWGWLRRNGDTGKTEGTAACFIRCYLCETVSLSHWRHRLVFEMADSVDESVFLGRIHTLKFLKEQLRRAVAGFVVIEVFVKTAVAVGDAKSKRFCWE